jgi:hypothetical protein
MNAPALLALMGDLYAQLLAAQDRIAQLEAQLERQQGANGASAGGRGAPSPQQAGQPAEH